MLPVDVKKVNMTLISKTKFLTSDDFLFRMLYFLLYPLAYYITYMH